MSRRRTLMAVHAHPDDEALFTGGVLARCRAEGIDTVLVTCTGGELGFGPGGVRPGDPGHDPAQVARIRRRDLEESCRILGVTHLERLGYGDSGMSGWPQNDAPGAFAAAPPAEASARLGELMERYRPDVVVTYDADGFYGHPDHVQAHRITVAASDSTGIPAKLYFVTVPRSSLAGFVDLAVSFGVELPEWLDGATDLGTADDLISAAVDCSGAIETKFAALAAHRSQEDIAFFLGLGLELYSEIFSIEHYVRARDRTGAPLPEDDLFAGVGQV
ncbi:MAG: PIG-L family deacetylase [Actinomycetota bacterium]|jgi:LmbE family N-acetylglucosaminyl deacetylase|nr:PIG-L family deacetylase [Actinomycetota bacterium]